MKQRLNLVDGLDGERGWSHEEVSPGPGCPFQEDSCGKVRMLSGDWSDDGTPSIDDHRSVSRAEPDLSRFTFKTH